jgi:hypothetical protein
MNSCGETHSMSLTPYVYTHAQHVHNYCVWVISQPKKSERWFSYITCTTSVQHLSHMRWAPQCVGLTPCERGVAPLLYMWCTFIIFQKILPLKELSHPYCPCSFLRVQENWLGRQSNVSQMNDGEPFPFLQVLKKVQPRRVKDGSFEIYQMTSNGPY